MPTDDEEEPQPLQTKESKKESKRLRFVVMYAGAFTLLSVTASGIALGQAVQANHTASEAKQCSIVAARVVRVDQARPDADRVSRIDDSIDAAQVKREGASSRLGR
ncbi:hypothetical protein ACH4SK_38390 [Streptomyces inhibens]|uniref:hypothetical protein n=1 Tax=Streptomyces inhibens TaxID=2293571 RepID=UPI0037A20279